MNCWECAYYKGREDWVGDCELTEHPCRLETEGECQEFEEE
jgi:hypothetical protein